MRSGVSTKAEVLALFGKPNGYGGAALPTNPRPHDMWFFNLFEMSIHAADGGYGMKGQVDVLLQLREPYHA